MVVMLKQNSPEWLEARRKGVGSSDCAAVCGLDEYRTSLDVWLDKTGRALERQQNDAMKMGHLLEPVIAQVYSDRTGKDLSKSGSMLTHPSMPFMFANPDYDVLGERRHVECKTANLRMAKEWGEEGSDWIPEGYLMQVQHQMACTGFEVCDVGVLIAGSDFRIYTVQRKPNLIATIESIVADFWKSVETDTPPEPDFAHRRTKELIKELFGVTEIKSIALPDWAAEAWQQQQELQFQIKALEEQREALLNKIKFVMGDAAIGTLPQGKRMLKRTWVQDTYWTDKDVEIAQASIGKIKRSGHVRLTEQAIK